MKELTKEEHERRHKEAKAAHEAALLQRAENLKVACNHVINPLYKKEKLK